MRLRNLFLLLMLSVPLIAGCKLSEVKGEVGDKEVQVKDKDAESDADHDRGRGNDDDFCPYGQRKKGRC